MPMHGTHIPIAIAILWHKIGMCRESHHSMCKCISRQQKIINLMNKYYTWVAGICMCMGMLYPNKNTEYTDKYSIHILNVIQSMECACRLQTSQTYTNTNTYTIHRDARSFECFKCWGKLTNEHSTQ